MAEEEIDFTEARPMIADTRTAEDRVAEVVRADFMKDVEAELGPLAKDAPTPEEIGKLEFEELSPELVRLLKHAKAQRAAWAEIEKRLVDEAKKLSGAEKRWDGKELVVPVGDHRLVFKRKAGSVTVDWEAYLAEHGEPKAWEMLEQTKEQVRKGISTCRWMKQGDDTVTLEKVL